MEEVDDDVLEEEESRWSSNLENHVCVYVCWDAERERKGGGEGRGGRRGGERARERAREPERERKRMMSEHTHTCVRVLVRGREKH